MKKITLLKSLLVVLAMSFFSVVALAQATTVGTYKKVTEAPADGDWSGQYIVTNADASKVFNCSLKNGNGEVPTYVKNNSGGFIVSSDKSTIEVTQALVDANLAANDGYQDPTGSFHITIDKDGYIKAACGYYIGAKPNSSKTGVTTGISYIAEVGENEGFKHTITLKADGSVLLNAKINNKNGYLQAYSVNFQYYTSSSKGAICLYKLETADGGEEGGGEVATLAAPTASLESGDYLEAFDLTLACATEGATIKYKVNGGEEQAYSAPIRISATTTLVAWSEKDGAKSEEVTFTYNLPAEVANIAAFIADESGKNVRIASTMTVVYVRTSYLYVKDESGYMLVNGKVNSKNPSYKVGDQFTGLVGTAKVVNGIKEITPANFPTATATGVAVEPEVVAMGNITTAIAHKYIVLEELATLVSKTQLGPIVASIAGKEYTMPDRFTLFVNGWKFVAGDMLKITAFVGFDANGNVELYPTAVEKIENVVETPAAPATPTIQYPEGGYFASEALDVALTATETRPNSILVTVDGSEPLFGATATQTLSSVKISATTTVKVRAILMTEEGKPYQNPDGTYVYSEVVSATFTKVEVPAAPVFTPAAGDYYDSVEVSIACATENTVVRYELSASEPTTTSTAYVAPFKLKAVTTVSAIAYLTDEKDGDIKDVNGLSIASAVATATYNVTPYEAPAAQPTTVGTYKKMTAAPANGDWSGQYLIVGISGLNYYIFKPSYKAITERIPTAQMADIVISEDMITVPQSTLDALIAYDSYYNGYDTKGEFHVIIDGEGGIKTPTGFYIGANNSSTKGMVFNADLTKAGAKNTFTFNADGSVKITSVNGSRTKTLRATGTGYCYHTSTSSLSGEAPVYLYKLVTDEGGEGEGGEGGEVATLAAPTADVQSGDYLEPLDLTLACATEGATIKYKVNGGEEQTYSAPIRISATTTLAAWAEKDGAKSEEVTFTYNLPTEVANIAAFIADESGKQVRIASTMTVVYVRTSYLYVKDESGYMLVNGKVNSKNPSYKVGDQFTGLVGTAKVVNGIKEITPANFPTATATGVAVEPEVVAMGNITTAIAHKYIVLEELATLVSKAQLGPIVASIAGKEYTMPDRFTLFVNGWKFVAGDMLKITAFVGFDANGNVELYPTAVEKEVVPVAPEAPVFTPVAGDYYDSVIVSISCATTENVMIKYAFGGTEPTGKSATYTEPFKLTTNTVVSAMAFLIDANGNPVEDAEGKPFASPAVFAEYKVTPYVAPAAPATPTIQYPEGGYFASEALEVALTTKETRPNSILVTVDGSEPLFGAKATQTLSSVKISATTTVKVRAILMTEEGKPYQTPKGEYIYSEVASATFTKVEAPAAPVFTPAAGDYYDSVIVSIACVTEKVMIKYEFGGTEPTGRSMTYAEPFKLTTTTVVSAMAFLKETEDATMPIMDVEGMPIASPATFIEYKVTPYVAPAAPATPTIQYPEGGYFASEALEVALTTKETRPNSILVTVDGSEPLFGAKATQTLSSVKISGTTTVKVRAILMTEEGKPYQNPDGTYVYSEVASATFTKVEAPAAPVFTPAAGDYYDSVIVSIACATEKVMIKYEFGGTEPTGRSMTYAEPFKLTTTTVVSAMAFLKETEDATMPIMDVEGMPIASPATFIEYKVAPYVAPAAPATPTIQYPEGGYFASEALEVALTTKETRPNNILVTVDGSEPLFGATATQTLSSVKISAITTVKVRAILMTEEGKPYQTPKGEYIYSEVASATFTKVEAPAAPVFTPVAGDYYDSVIVSIACDTENVMIKYEFGGTEPTGRSMTYAEPFKLFENTVVSAVAYLTNAEGDPIFDVEELPIASEAVFAEYVIKETILPPVAPVFSPEAGEFIDSVVVTLACETENTVILYDLLGLQPNFTSPRFEEPIIIKETTTIAAMAILVDEEGEVILNEEEMPYMSELVTATYVVKPGEIVGVEDIELVAVVYTKGGMIYVDTELGNMIEVFTVQGQCIYSAEATSELTSIDAINADVLLVKVNDQVIKVAIK